ncbi:hypothetical protein IE077_004055 [Cardiosporidium cionae]|uniref:Uncharacterized protein n=1 Tax=Cardiosporidium cionae TaxID=476202 RepID=A0ABQ7J6X1_9APIC|nr:hypothetical protein IE077_004055 [Cardiosporidium cionae]|eukprot:KAF8819739.1 hypothetical protein IE077_004055 [Cardiosporidium cionae]
MTTDRNGCAPIKQLLMQKYMHETCISEFFVSHANLVEKLRRIAEAYKNGGSLQHLIFYGPRQIEKVVHACHFIASLYNDESFKKVFETDPLPETSVDDLRYSFAQWDNRMVMSVQCRLLLNCGREDSRIQDLCKRLRQAYLFPSNFFKTFLLLEFDCLDRDVQRCIASNMRKSKNLCVLIVDEFSKAESLIKGMCISVRVCKPMIEELESFLIHVSTTDRFFSKKKLPQDYTAYVHSLCIQTKCRAFEALILLENAATSGFATVDTLVNLNKNPAMIKLVEIITKKSTRSLQKQLSDARVVFYDMLIHQNPPSTEDILQELLDSLSTLHKKDPEYMHNLAQNLADTSGSLVHGTFPIMHLEHLCVKLLLLEDMFCSDNSQQESLRNASTPL